MTKRNDKGNTDEGNEARDFMLHIVQTLIAMPWLKLADMMATPDGKHLLEQVLTLRQCTGAVFFAGVMAGADKKQDIPEGVLAEETSRLAMNILQAAIYAGAEWAIKSGTTLEQLNALQVPDVTPDDDITPEQADKLLKDFLSGNKPA